MKKADCKVQIAKCNLGRVGPLALVVVAFLLLVGGGEFARAAVKGQVGPYRVELTTEPAVIPIGKVRLNIRITDTAGLPIQGAQVRTLVKMPTMNMGEKQTTARAAGKPGVYTTEASFMMEGGYEASLDITGPQGAATGSVGLQTGMDTLGAGTGSPLSSLTPWLLAAILVLFIIARMRRNGQRPNVRALANRGAFGGIVLLAVMFGVSLYAVSHWRRPGAMTPIEAQAMEMNTPAPPGTAAVTLAEVTRGPVESTVRYTGQAVGFNEQDVMARVQGWLTWMPYYNGQKVKRGELIGRLDTSQIQPQIAQQQAGVNMAEQGVAVARKEYEQARAEVHLAHGEIGMREAAVREARANVEAAREERAAAEATVASAESKVSDAQAALQAARADQHYWQEEIGREKTLLSKGAVSLDEYQKELAQASAADARVSQAQAGLLQAQADVRAAQAAIRKAGAMVAAASNRVQSASAELSSHRAHVQSAEASAAAAKQKIEQMQAGVQQAQAGLAGVATARGYSEIRAQIDGVITQRIISPGQLVNPGQAIVRVAQVNPIRLQANVSESDLMLIKTGSRVVARGQGERSTPVVATVTSIAPSVDPVARTGVVEAVVANPKGRFMPGQFVTMDISIGQSQSALRVPVAAVRTRTSAGIGMAAASPGSFVWVADAVEGEQGRYPVRQVEVKTGNSDGVNVEIVSGLKAGQQVVVVGGDYLKAGDTVTTGEREARPSSGGTIESMPGMSHQNHGPQTPPVTGPNEATVEVSARGFTPDSVSLKAGMPARLTFIRKDTKNCADTVLLPEYGIKRGLPLNQPVVIEFTPNSGTLTFTCGMNMLSGKVVAR